jgi:hypothetical protein
LSFVLRGCWWRPRLLAARDEMLRSRPCSRLFDQMQCVQRKLLRARSTLNTYLISKIHMFT